MTVVKDERKGVKKILYLNSRMDDMGEIVRSKDVEVMKLKKKESMYTTIKKLKDISS